MFRIVIVIITYYHHKPVDRIYKIRFSIDFGLRWCSESFVPLMFVGIQEVAGMVVLQWNCRTYGNAYLITFKVGPFHTHTHTHIRVRARTLSLSLSLSLSRSINPAIVGSTGGRLLLEFSGVRPSHSIWYPPWLRNVCRLKAHFQSHSGRYPVSTAVGWWQELLHNKRFVARCVIVMQKTLSLPAICRAASSAKLAYRNDQ
jgi:hypothetical protein